jgi:hypothetical protein
MIRVTRQIKCLIAQAPGVIPHPLPEVNFLMVEIPTLKPYIYSLFSYLFIKQDQMIMTCNSAVASLMLSRFLCLSCFTNTLEYQRKNYCFRKDKTDLKLFCYNYPGCVCSVNYQSFV